jgi:hypothetical protein
MHRRNGVGDATRRSRSNEEQATARPRDDARQHARAGRAGAEPQFVGLPTFMNINN